MASSPTEIISPAASLSDAKRMATAGYRFQPSLVLQTSVPILGFLSTGHTSSPLVSSTKRAPDSAVAASAISVPTLADDSGSLPTTRSESPEPRSPLACPRSISTVTSSAVPPAALPRSADRQSRTTASPTPSPTATTSAGSSAATLSSSAERPFAINPTATTPATTVCSATSTTTAPIPLAPLAQMTHGPISSRTSPLPSGRAPMSRNGDSASVATPSSSSTTGRSPQTSLLTSACAGNRISPSP